MKRFALAVIASAVGTSASVENLQGTQNHVVQKRFLLEPCSAVIAAIDNPSPGMIGAGDMAMTFGFLMGFEAINPNIRGDHETILMRLRADCAQQDSKTAMTLLKSYAEEAGH